ncbi:hypothetical protein S40293_10613 [Stachybotrys chartarum IBT 40293]|nr:hypothetical protein S40293_10613 [Stachybotrys chartarum IBT 40293]
MWKRCAYEPPTSEQEPIEDGEGINVQWTEDIRRPLLAVRLPRTVRCSPTHQRGPRLSYVQQKPGNWGVLDHTQRNCDVCGHAILIPKPRNDSRAESPPGERGGTAKGGINGLRLREKSPGRALQTCKTFTRVSLPKPDGAQGQPLLNAGGTWQHNGVGNGILPAPKWAATGACTPPPEAQQCTVAGHPLDRPPFALTGHPPTACMDGTLPLPPLLGTHQAQTLPADPTRPGSTVQYEVLASTARPASVSFRGFRPVFIIILHPTHQLNLQLPFGSVKGETEREREREVAGFGASSSTTRRRVPSHRGFAPVGAVRSIAAHPPPPFPSLSLAVVLCPDPGKAQVALGD